MKKRKGYYVIAVSLYPQEIGMLDRLTTHLRHRLNGTGIRANRSRTVGYALRKATARSGEGRG